MYVFEETEERTKQGRKEQSTALILARKKVWLRYLSQEDHNFKKRKCFSKSSHLCAVYAKNTIYVPSLLNATPR
jgi:hypothetical protein